MAFPRHGTDLKQQVAANSGALTPTANDGEQIYPIGDNKGRRWVRLHDGTAPVTAANPLPVDVVGDLDNLTWVDPASLLVSAVSVAAPSKLVSLLATNTVATNYYLHIFDAAVLPTTLVTVPNVIGLLPALGMFSYSIPRVMANGITWALSSTPAVYTAVGSADAWVNVAHQTTP